LFKGILVSYHALVGMAGKNPGLCFRVIAFPGIFLFYMGFNVRVQTVVILKKLSAVLGFVN
jgi:hypothetical protein